MYTIGDMAKEGSKLKVHDEKYGSIVLQLD